VPRDTHLSVRVKGAKAINITGGGLHGVRQGLSILPGQDDLSSQDSVLGLTAILRAIAHERVHVERPGLVEGGARIDDEFVSGELGASRCVKICAQLIHVVVFFLVIVIRQALAVELEVLGVSIGALVFVKESECVAWPIITQF
jgi:hypothetical protein